MIPLAFDSQESDRQVWPEGGVLCLGDHQKGQQHLQDLGVYLPQTAHGDDRAG